jgi:hypothetical protein
VEASRLTIECRSFGDLNDVIRAACGARDASWTSPQFEYIQSYLQRGTARAKTMVVEQPYVDRHYLEEYGAYYFSAFRNGGPTTTRIHFFDIEFDRNELSEWVQAAASGDAEKRDKIQGDLDDAFIGFMTVRPIPSAPIGRTILRPYKDKPTRSYIPSEGGHPVHLLGFELKARGLPFQQQEQAVGACATTALWSAMSRVVRADGGRAPTPYSVTQAATRHYLQDRALPAVSGLELAQLTAAVRELGYSPYVLKPAREHGTFALSLKCYLYSGIPAVLVLEDPRGGYHAVTASGYRLGDDEEPAADIKVEFLDEGGELSSKGISRIYVHDDRFGPYVRMKLTPPIDPQGDTVLERIGPATGDPAHGAGGNVCYALFPLYPKLRLTARELIGLGLDMLPVVRSVLTEAERSTLNVEVFFAHGGRYQRRLLSSGLEDPARVERFLSGTALSRYVGVVRFQLDDGALVDIVCDTTDIRRDYPRRAPVLAVFPFAAKLVPTFTQALASMAPWAMVV